MTAAELASVLAALPELSPDVEINFGGVQEILDNCDAGTLQPEQLEPHKVAVYWFINYCQRCDDLGNRLARADAVQAPISLAEAIII